MDGIKEDPGTWLERALWFGRIEDLPKQVEAAMAEGLLEDAEAVARVAGCLSQPPALVTNIIGRLRHLGLALHGSGECRLQVQVWRAALRHGMEPRNGWQRLFDTAFAIDDWPTVLEASSWLSEMTRPRPHWLTHTQTAVTKLLDGESIPQTSAVAMVLKWTGLRFLTDLLQRPGPTMLADIVLAKGGFSPATTVMLATALASRAHLDAARRIAAALQGEEAVTIAIAACAVAESRFDAAHKALDQLATSEVTVASEDLLLPWAFLAASVAHDSLPALAHRVARLPGVLTRLTALFIAMGERVDALAALMAALVEAGLDPLELLDIKLATTVAIDEPQMRHAIALVDDDSSFRRPDRILTLAQQLIESETTGTALAADFCRRHFAGLIVTQAGATLLARALTRVQDWEGAMHAWDALIALQPAASWAFGQAYLSAAKADQADRAASYLARVNLTDSASQSALMAVAYGACVLGDFETGLHCLAILDALPISSPARLQDRHNLCGRLNAALTGSANLLVRSHGSVGYEPIECSSPRALIIDPGFAVNDGHHFAYTLFATQFFATEMGIGIDEVWTCVSMVGETAVQEDDASVRTSLRRIFGFNPYAFEEFPKAERILRNVAKAWESDLTRAFVDRDLDHVEVIYCHSMKATMAVGFARWVTARFSGRRIAVVIGIIEVDYMAQGAETSLNCNVAYSEAMQHLREASGVHLVLYAETAYAVRELSRVLGPEIAVHNIPYLAASLAGPASTAHVAFSRETVTIGLVGGSRRERGLDLFPELILAMADIPDVRWVVQLSRNLAEQMDGVFPSYLQWAVDRGICAWYDGRLDTADYHAALRQMDIVLMPYRERYAVSGSGVFYEAIELERYLVVPQDTFMADVLRDWSYPREVMSSASVPAALRSLQHILQRRKAVVQEMQALRAAAGERLPLGHFRTLIRAALVYVRGSE